MLSFREKRSFSSALGNEHDDANECYNEGDDRHYNVKVVDDC